MSCGEPVTPPGVLAPYERGTEVTRAAKSQRERDDDAKRTVLLAGEFLRRVGALLDDPKIHPASADLLDWYREEITEARRARNAHRLAELAGEFKADTEARAFRRVHWWQGQPAALGAAVDDEPDEDQPDEDQADEGAALTTPAGIAGHQQHTPPKRATWAEALAARGWRLADPDGSGACQVTDRGARCVQPVGGNPPVTDALTRHGWTCSGHYGALGATITAINHERGLS